jgi:uncharacterized Zn finger protein
MAERELQKLKGKGQPISPVVIEGRTIASTFWGKAWCDNLERYSDFSNRLPRGRTYARNGSVVDLQIGPGEVSAMVSGSSLYKVAIKVSAVPPARWTSLCCDCAGAIDSLVELLQGRFSQGVMERMCQQKTGLFPAPTELEFSCSCPDWASMCKHVAAVFYGIGARLDAQPELIFRLRRVDEKDLIAGAGKGLPLSKRAPDEQRVLHGDGLSELFGLELGTLDDEPTVEAAHVRPKANGTKKKRKTKTPRQPPKAAARVVTLGSTKSSASTKKKTKKKATKAQQTAQPKTRAGKKKTQKRRG